MGKSPWIIDSGASCHMMGNGQLLKKKMPVSPIPVNLPNGANIVVNMEGSMSLSP